MTDQTTRVRRALDAQSSRFLEFDSSTRCTRIDFAALAEVTTQILRAEAAEFAADLLALANRWDSVPVEQNLWSMDQTLGWCAARDASSADLRDAVVHQTGGAS
ncbi:MAG TPA: hypothetical protein VHX38_35745 [Pseudonocardiaceae bacterium]|nr:hypothetical protein [Pseudonocardiaceae bacterium]